MVEYKLIYKMPGKVQWEFFWLTSANSDMKALTMAGTWAHNNKVEAYKLEKITTERLV